LKLVLFTPLGAPGLAAATAVGAWVNLLLLVFFAIRRKAMKIDLVLWKTSTCVVAASCALAVFSLLALRPVEQLASRLGHFVNEFELLALGVSGAAVYALVLLIGLRLSGVQLRRKRAAKV
jgi:putative peptidoglycan lipid II flippase